jgi:branched-chain amino acid transport system permease protein
MTPDRPRVQVLSLLASGVVLAVAPWVLGGGQYVFRITTVMLTYATYAVAFNLIFGHTKQLFLCVGALAGSSAYLSVVLVRDLGWPPLLTVGLGLLFAAVLGGFLSYVAVRRGLGVIFVGIVTLAVSLIFQNLLLGLRRYTNGETGIVTQGLGIGLGRYPVASYYAFLGLLLLALVVYARLMASPAGLAFRALSGDELAAELAGVDVTRYKVLAATVGSGLMGLTGALFADYNGFINPSIFSLAHVDIVVLIVLILGGMRTLMGPVVGAGAFTVIDHLVRPFGQVTVLVYGAFLIILFLAFRDGLVPALRRAARLPVP